ncbi:sugar phosphate isomerase/epimerase family protein [Nonomuraea rubra]|uniref:sugar phosphate isomerase/epimerase family protein n=1 Tax=Nonomuraea rubra TaxID=46180 RepID=UPI0033FFF2DB
MHQAPFHDALRGLAAAGFRASLDAVLGDARQLSAVVDEIAAPNLGIAYDVANTIGQEGPLDGVRTAGHRIRIAHMSDTWRGLWAHTSPGRGEVDFARCAEVLRSIGFGGVTVFELIDLEPPLPRLHDDLATFEKRLERRAIGHGALAPVQYVARGSQ